MGAKRSQLSLKLVALTFRSRSLVPCARHLIARRHQPLRRGKGTGKRGFVTCFQAHCIHVRKLHALIKPTSPAPPSSATKLVNKSSGGHKMEGTGRFGHLNAYDDDGCR